MDRIVHVVDWLSMKIYGRQAHVCKALEGKQKEHMVISLFRHL